ncbi:unnamed protein product [Gongylonema pulchrum]|uniref:Peptidase S59 domain-containing protein n=1 Tax=Gongylonema pulchrum TaxID=637853 RepID=A0A183EVF6_9BILA|nr:unnamed protein product [Gongylonema pulchrum]
MPATTFGSQRFAQPIGVPSNRLPSFGSQSTYEKPFNRYVNARQDPGTSDREPTPPRLDYAAITVGQSDESLSAIARYFQGKFRLPEVPLYQKKVVDS